jgi:hypothetical protein
VLECQTVSSCAHTFAWMESRAAALTGEITRGRSLTLLRALNELSRRVSRAGRGAVLSGRILAFLGAALPLEERSGLNLRGSYGAPWTDVHVDAGKPEDEDPMHTDGDAGTADYAEKKTQEKAGAHACPPSRAAPAERIHADFYNTFWALQAPFAAPPSFAAPGVFAAFQERVDKVLPVLKEASAKDRAMMGSRAGTAVKRKRGADEPAENYFFAKYLTSPDLLELEVRLPAAPRARLS